MPSTRLSQFIMLPELVITWTGKSKKSKDFVFKVEKKNPFEVCPHCAQKAFGVYDRRTVKLKDAPIHGKKVFLIVKKRRFYCKSCRKPFTEPISGVSKGKRTTARYQRHLLWACQNFQNMKQVKRHLGCSNSYLYKTHYQELERKQKTRLNPWPKTIGIDEHKWGKDHKYGIPLFASIIVDHKNKRVKELVNGRSKLELKEALANIPGRLNVQRVTMDLSSTYRGFVRDFFPNAKIVADHFHVVRLLHPAINKARKKITGDVRKLPVRKLLLKNGRKLEFTKKLILIKWLNQHPELKELWEFKEALHRLYRCKGRERAKRSLKNLIDKMAKSRLKDIKTLRRTLIKWKHEILNFFENRLSNGRVEGFNCKTKLIRKEAYGYRSFKNYRLKVLNACS